MKKKYIAVVILTALLFNSATTYGEDIEDIKEKYQDINSQKTEIENQLDRNNAVMNRMKEELSAMEADLLSISEELKKEEQSLDKLSREISTSKDELKLAENRLDEKQELLGSRLSSMYRRSASSYIEVILGSRDIVELLDRVNMVKSIVTHDQDVIEEVKTEKEDIIAKREELEAREKEAKATAKKLEQKKLEAVNLAKSKEVIVESLKKNEEGYKAQIDSLEEQSNRALDEIRQIEENKAAEEALKNNSSPPSSGGGDGSYHEGNTPEVDYSNLEKGEAMIVKATAYDPSPESNGGYGGITAMGTTLRPGVIAVDPKVIPLGTKVYIEYMDGTPLGNCIAEDTGGAIKGNRIDILFMSKGEAMQFGVRDMKLYILE